MIRLYTYNHAICSKEPCEASYKFVSATFPNDNSILDGFSDLLQRLFGLDFLFLQKEREGTCVSIQVKVT